MNESGFIKLHGLDSPKGMPSAEPMTDQISRLLVIEKKPQIN
jgi:hypothetical protein